MATSHEIRIEYIRPGKDVSEYIEQLVAETDKYIKTFKVFPQEVVERLSQSLRRDGFIAQDQMTTSVAKFYFFDEYFDLLLFQDEQGNTLGYYSDICTPLIKTPAGYRMTDWFLDIWLSPDGTLFELDIDEFEEALARGLIQAGEAEIARRTFARLIEEVKQGMYPHAYLK